MDSRNRRWEIINKISNFPFGLAQGGQFPISSEKIVDLLLKNRGIKTNKDKKEFFKPIHPSEISLKTLRIKEAEVKRAIARIREAKKSKEKVIVYGDYDADGVCATAILWECLWSLGLNVLPYIPERFSEGYGLNIETISKLKSQNSNLGLIITVDHGIVASEKIDFAKEVGIDVIVTDHHQPSKAKPKALAIIHTVDIGGAGVAWILSREVARKFQFSPAKRTKYSKFQINNSLELAALGTIADQLQLLGPNRSFVKYGLEELNKTQRVGLLSLFKESGITKGEIGTYQVNFLIAPRINAMGRLEHAIDSLRLLCTKNKKKAEELADNMGKINSRRQAVLGEISSHAINLVNHQSFGRIIVLAHESYHEGVIGLAAGKLVEEFYRPAIVISKKAKISKASARSVSGFNIIEAIRKHEDLILEGGGHPMAAGFSILTKRISEFKRKINKTSKKLLTAGILTKKLRIDLELDFKQINKEFLEKLASFEPVGLGNPTPIFATKDVSVLDARLVGADKKHLRLRLEKEGKVFAGIAFGMGDIYSKFTPDKNIDIAYSLEEDSWNGNNKIQLKIRDIKV